MVRCALFLVAAAAFVALVSSDEQPEKILNKEVAEKCFQESNSTPGDLKAFGDGATHSNELKCFLKCLTVAKKGLNADGSLNSENIIKVIGADKRASVEKCAVQAPSTDLCEKAFEFDSCLLANEPQYVRGVIAHITA